MSARLPPWYGGDSWRSRVVFSDFSQDFERGRLSVLVETVATLR